MQPATKTKAQSSPQPTATRNRLLERILTLIVFLPVLVTFLYVRSLSVEVPFSDDWDMFIPPFHQQVIGNLQWSDINSQHNEHIVIFPLAASLILAKLTGGQLLPITYLSYAFLCGSLGVLFLFFRMLHLPGRWNILWFLPASLLFLGWRQWEGLLFSTHLANTMALFFVLAATYCCTQAGRAPIFFLAAIASAWIASFSVASGLLAWLCGAAALMLAGTSEMRFEQRLRHMAGWLVTAAVCVGCFVMDSAPNPVAWPTGLAFVAAHKLDAAHYILTYLGASLGGTAPQAEHAGMVFVLIALPVLFLALKRFRTDGVLPGLLIAGYVGITLVPLVPGRLGLGVPQAFASRYATLAGLAPVGIYFCSLSLARTVNTGRYLAVAMILLMSVGILNSYTSGLTAGRKEWAGRTACVAAVKNFRQIDRKALICGYPDARVIIERTPVMVQDHLSLFGR